MNTMNKKIIFIGLSILFSSLAALAGEGQPSCQQTTTRLYYCSPYNNPKSVVLYLQEIRVSDNHILFTQAIKSYPEGNSASIATRLCEDQAIVMNKSVRFY